MLWFALHQCEGGGTLYSPFMTPPLLHSGAHFSRPAGMRAARTHCARGMLDCAAVSVDDSNEHATRHARRGREAACNAAGVHPCGPHTRTARLLAGCQPASRACTAARTAARVFPTVCRALPCHGEAVVRGRERGGAPPGFVDELVSHVAKYARAHVRTFIHGAGHSANMGAGMHIVFFAVARVALQSWKCWRTVI